MFSYVIMPPYYTVNITGWYNFTPKKIGMEFIFYLCFLHSHFKQYTNPNKPLFSIFIRRFVSFPL